MKIIQTGDIHVGEWFSCEVSNLEIETSFGGDPIIPGNGIMLEGEDAHIIADVHVCGAVPTENLAVTAKAEKVYWEDLYTTDCGSAMDWEFNHFGDTPSLWHITDKDSWDEGGEALACFNEDTMHYENDMYIKMEEIIDNFFDSGIIINKSSKISGERLLKNGHKSLYSIFDGFYESKKYIEKIKIIIEVWNCGIEGNSIICLGYSEITDNEHNNPNINTYYWNRMVGDISFNFKNDNFNNEDTLIYNVICH